MVQCCLASLLRVISRSNNTLLHSHEYLIYWWSGITLLRYTTCRVFARSGYAILHPHNGCSFSTLDMRKCCLLSPYPITRVSCNLQSQRTATYYYIHTLAHVIHIHVSKHYIIYNSQILNITQRPCSKLSHSSSPQLCSREVQCLFKSS